MTNFSDLVTSVNANNAELAFGAPVPTNMVVKGNSGGSRDTVDRSALTVSRCSRVTGSTAHNAAITGLHAANSQGVELNTPNAIFGWLIQEGPNDGTAIFGRCENRSAANTGHASFGGFFIATVERPGNGACGIEVQVENRSGQSHPAGAVNYLVGVDVNYEGPGTMGSVGVQVRTGGQAKWDMAYTSPGFHVTGDGVVNAPSYELGGNTGIYSGAGQPSFKARKGSLFLRTDGNNKYNRAYINTDGGTSWTALLTAA